MRDLPHDMVKTLEALLRDETPWVQYDTTFRAEGIADVEKIGLAYFKNAVEICR